MSAENPQKVIKEETKEKTQKEEKPQVTSKFNLLEQGSKMLISANTTGGREETKNLIILGSKHSGKSSIFTLLTTKEKIISNDYIPTYGINFGFMRYQHTNSSKKQLINIYEIGGGIENISLLGSLLNSKNIQNTLIFLVIDFEKPKTALKVLNNFLKNISKIIQTSIDKEVQEDFITFKKNLFPKNKKENAHSKIDIMPANVFIVGNKYDIIEKIDLDKLKWLCRSLRYFALSNGVGLIFHSNFNEKLIKILTSTVTQFAFGQSQIEGIDKKYQKNETKALYLNFNNDSFDEIGDPKVMQSGGGDMKSLWEETYNSLFAKEKEIKEIETTVEEKLYEIYKESRIDNEMNIFQNAKEKQKLQKELKKENASKSKK